MDNEPLTKKQLDRVHQQQLEVVERLEKLLKMPEAKDMIREISITGNLVLDKGGLYIFKPGGIGDPDYGTWWPDSYEKVKPTRELVERFDIEAGDVERIAKRLRA